MPVTKLIEPRIMDAQAGRRNFILFFLSNFVSAFGSQIAFFSLPFALIAHGYTPLMIATVAGANSAPIIVITLFAGVLGDRWSRCKIMIIADILRCGAQGILAYMLTLPQPEYALIILLAMLVGVGNALYYPAQEALIPDIAPRNLEAANSLSSLSLSLSIIVGPAIAAFLVHASGGATAIGVDACSYALSALALACLQKVTQTFHSENSASGLRAGWREFTKHRWLAQITMQIGLLNLLVFAPIVVLGPVIFSESSYGIWLWSFVTSASGIGGILTGLLLLKVKPSYPILAIQIAMSFIVIPFILLALHASALPLIIGGGLYGASLTAVGILFQSTIQTQISGEYLARINAIVSFVEASLIPIGFGICGPITQLIGTANFLFTSSAIILASIALSLFIKRTWAHRNSLSVL